MRWGAPGGGMARAAGWTIGLFGAGMLVCGLFPIPWIEPLVLFGLGFAFLVVSSRTGTGARRARPVTAKGATA
jgi:hypothetical protein